MKVRNYKCTFFKREEKLDPKTGEVVEKTYKVLGSVTVDDANTSCSLPLATKAMRHAPSVCQSADKLSFTEIK